MNAEIYLTVLKDDNRLVISGELGLLREFLATFIEGKGHSAPTVYNPAPDQHSDAAIP